MNTNLSETVSTYLLANNLGKAEFSRIYQIGIKGIKDINQDVAGQAKYYDVQLDCRLSGKLPEDFMNETRVFLCGCDNAGLLKDNALNNFDYDDDDYDENSFNELFVPEVDTRSTRNSGGIDWVGRYRIDRDSNRIYVNPEFCYSAITVEYLGTPNVSESGDWFINELCTEALEAYIRWKDSLGKQSVGLYEKMQNGREYQKEKKKARRRMLNTTRGQLQQNARSATKFKLKQ